jgi:hypothetical protein
MLLEERFDTHNSLLCVVLFGCRHCYAHISISRNLAKYSKDSQIQTELQQASKLKKQRESDMLALYPRTILLQ